MFLAPMFAVVLVVSALVTPAIINSHEGTTNNQAQVTMTEQQSMLAEQEVGLN